MKYLSGTRNRSITYTVEPARQITDMSSGKSQTTPAIRAKFTEHKFDSLVAEQTENWQQIDRDRKQEPGTTRKQVEEYLQNHQDFGRSDGRGIFLDNVASVTELELRAKGVKRRCIYMQDVGDDTIQCNDIVEDSESDYCPPHEQLVKEELSRRGVEESAQQPVPAAATTGPADPPTWD